MPQWTSAGDFGVDNLPNYGGRGVQSYRPSNAVNTYTPGIVLGRVALDSDVYPDFQTAQPLAAGTTTPGVVGVVSPDWAGFDNAGAAASFISAASYTNVQGTSFIRAVVKGIAYVFVDQAGSGAVTITNGIPLVSSRNTAGYGQGVAVATATNRGSLIGAANLPASGLGSSLTAAALAQASTDFTVATPAAGDIVNTIIQSPYTDAQPGTVQTTTWSLALNSTTAASATTAGAAIVAFLNAQPSFSQYFTATNTAGAVHVAVNTLAAAFLVTFGTTTLAGNATESGRFYTHISGMGANLLTTVGSVTGGGGTTYSAAGTTFGGGTSPGTGYKGKVPALIYGAY